MKLLFLTRQLFHGLVRGFKVLSGTQFIHVKMKNSKNKQMNLICVQPIKNLDKDKQNLISRSRGLTFLKL